MSDEAHFSAEQSGSGPSARLSGTDGNGRRPRRDSGPSRSRPEKAVGLTVIRARKDFLAANAARRSAQGGFVLLMRPREDGNPEMRLGITITKKIGNAVVRNRMRRRFRALARDILPQQGVAGADHVLIGRASGIERDFAALRLDLAKALAAVSR